MNQHATLTPFSRRSFIKASAALAALAASTRLPGVLAQTAALNVLNSNVAWSEALTSAVAAAYPAARLSGESNPYDSHYEKLIIELSQHSSTFDLISADNIWLAQAIQNGWAVNLSELKAKNPELPELQMDNLSKAAAIYTQVNGQRFGLPLVQTTPVFVYRKDLFERAGIDKVPRNWDEFLDAAKKLHSNETAGAILLLGGQDALVAGDWGSRLMGMAQVAEGADPMFDLDDHPIFNSQGQGERALERLRELLPWCPRGVQGFDYPEGSSALREGKAAMMITWSDVIVGLEDGPFKGKFGYTVSPTERYEQQMIGGWSLFINAASKNITEAYRFLAWMTAGRAYELFREGGESSLCLNSDLASPDVIHSIPMLQGFVDFNLHATRSIGLPCYRLANMVEVQRILFEELQQSLIGDKSAKRAMADAERRAVRAIKG